MYATKEAIIAKEHDPNIEPTIFYIDIRSFGKGFEPYIDRAKKEHGVRYVRCMVFFSKRSAGHPQPENHVCLLRRRRRKTTGSARRRVRPGGAVCWIETFEGDSSHGRAPGNASLNEFGFTESKKFSPAQTSRPGVFVAGAFAEPKDIPESVIEASCAAAQASALLGTARSTLTKIPVYPPERDISDEQERVGVFICHCGINIGSVVNVPEVVEYIKTLPGVAYAEHNLYTCSQDTQERIVTRIKEQGLNRVVVASCTPRTHEPLFQDTLKQSGLNPHLFEMANIREQDSWVHKGKPEIATEKAKQLATMAVAKARKLRPITRSMFDVDRRALVIGGGLAGMTAALSIARQGYEVYLVEREAELGGNLRHIFVGEGELWSPRSGRTSKPNPILRSCFARPLQL